MGRQARAGPSSLDPHEIERHFARSMFVLEAACVWSDGGSRQTRLVVVPDRAALRANGLTGVGELIRFEFETLAVQYAPPLPLPEVSFTFDRLPRTADGDIDRLALADRRERHIVGHRRSALPESMAAQVVRDAIAAARGPATGASVIDADTNLELDLDLDSLARAALFADVEMRLGRPPTASGLTCDDVFTVGDLVARVEAMAPAGDVRAGTARRPREVRDPWRAVLAEAPADDPHLAELARRKPVRALAFWCLLRALRLAAWPFLRIEVRGREHLQAPRPALICANHESFLDAFVISAILPAHQLRHVFYLGATEYFATPLMAGIARAINLIPVDADRRLARAMQVAAAGLRSGKILVIFPEGERSIDGTVRTFRDGTARLAQATRSLMVPVATRGLFDLWPRGHGCRWRRLRPWRPARVTVVVGRPIALQDDSVEDTTRVLRDTVTTLWESAGRDRA